MQEPNVGIPQPFPFQLLIMSLLGSLLAGGIYAVIVYFIQWDFFLIFPVAIAMIIYAIARRTMIRDVIRDKKTVFLIGALSIIVAFATQQTASAYLARQKEIDTLIKEVKKAYQYEATKQEAEEFVDSFYKEETGQQGLPGAILYSLKSANVSFSRSLDSDDAVGVGIVGGTIILLVEMGIAGFVLMGPLKSQLTAPFCETCQTWKKGRDIYTVGDFASHKDVMAALESKNIGSLKALSTNDSIKKDNYTRLVIYKCETCTSAVDVEVVSFGRKKKFSKVETITSKNTVPLTKDEYVKLKGELASSALIK